MGQLTRDQIVSEGQLLAGRDDMATQANGWLQRWLDAVAASWPWPVLQQEVVGIALGQGVQSIEFGAGTSVTEKVQKILDNLWLYTSERTFRRRLRIKHQLSDPGDRIGPAADTGAPSALRIFATNPYVAGRWTLRFDRIPDRAYLLTVPYLVLPAALTLGTDIPWFPNDETMVQAVAFKVSEFHNGKDSPVTQAFQQNLAGLIANDRIRYGAINGVNDTLALDPNVFKPRR